MICLNKKVWLLAGLVSMAGLVAACDEDSGSDDSCDSSYAESCVDGLHFFCLAGKVQFEGCSCAADAKTCSSSSNNNNGSNNDNNNDNNTHTCASGEGTMAAGTTSGDWTYTGCACDSSYTKKCGTVNGAEVVYDCYKGNEKYKSCSSCSVDTATNYYTCGGHGGSTNDSSNYNGQGSVNKVESSYSELDINDSSLETKNLETFGESSVVEGEFEVISCGTLSISSSNTCEKTGSGSNIIIKGDILAVDKIYKGGSVVVSGNEITYVGCTPENEDSATVYTCPDAVVTPGFINAHDHITYSNAAPDDWGAERFDHRNDWRKNKNGHTNHNGDSTSNNEVGELRQLLSGTTSVFGSGSVPGLIRNVDKAKVGSNPNGYPAYQTFPLGDSVGGFCSNSTKACGCSTYKYNLSSSNYYFGPHVAEGINDYAVNELRCLAGEGAGSRNVLNSKFSVIHGVGATPDLIKKMADAKSKLIWSPRTNVSLYGDTARVTVYDNLGVTIALGTDWIYSGSANMLREYECADFLNSYYYNKQFSDFDLWKMGTINSAIALGLDPVLGSLEAGKIADIAVFAKHGRSEHRAILEADNGDVAMVMLDGKIAVGDANIMSSGITETICNVEKKIDTSVTGTSQSYSSIKNNAKYSLYFCNSDGRPQKEPTCVPMRTRAVDTTKQGVTLYDGQYTDANDRDGDGIINSVDNCPDVFNPVRPEDRDASNVLGQADYDGDGVGDVCDKAPLDPTVK